MAECPPDSPSRRTAGAGLGTSIRAGQPPPLIRKHPRIKNPPESEQKSPPVVVYTNGAKKSSSSGNPKVGVNLCGIFSAYGTYESPVSEQAKDELLRGQVARDAHWI